MHHHTGVVTASAHDVCVRITARRKSFAFAFCKNLSLLLFAAATTTTTKV
jgi:hypothetical protein